MSKGAATLDVKSSTETHHAQTPMIDAIRHIAAVFL